MAFGVLPPGFGGASMMAQQAPRMNLAPIIPVVLRILSDVGLMRSLKMGVNFLDSSAFLNVSLVSLKSAPYAFHGEQTYIKEFDNPVSCRLRFFEAAAMATASAVYNFVFATIFSVLSLVTFGKIKMFTDQMRKQWTHTALAAASIAVGAVGTFSPKLGVQANLAAGVAAGVVLFQGMESGIVRGVCNAYHRNHTDLMEAGLQSVNDDPDAFARTFGRLTNYLETNLTDRVETLPQLLEVFQGAQAHFNIWDYVSVNSLMENGLQLLNQFQNNMAQPEQQGPLVMP